MKNSCPRPPWARLLTRCLGSPAPTVRTLAPGRLCQGEKPHQVTPPRPWSRLIFSLAMLTATQFSCDLMDNFLCNSNSYWFSIAQSRVTLF